ncbi:TetR/AcrR family transcriptional regulator [Actinokineospora guangxiensis]|uniref:TetR/AcrR family transcriptional regulator n=1 Tax=Actinokineospora guangxiensis TaxID=1490288 RepID=A0ABW0EPP1_9PSEU
MDAVLAHRSRPSLIERRKAALRLDIARQAVRLFVAKGVGATTGDEIADAVGISSRTLWRYFPTKESCVRPLLTSSLDAVTALLRDWPADTSLLDHIARALRVGALAPPDPAILDLIRMTTADPALRAVWLQAHDDALPALHTLLADRAGTTEDDLRVKVHAAVLSSALRAAAEDFALHSAGADLSACLETALSAAAEGLPY